TSSRLPIAGPHRDGPAVDAEPDTPTQDAHPCVLRVSLHGPMDDRTGELGAVQEAWVQRFGVGRKRLSPERRPPVPDLGKGRRRRFPAPLRWAREKRSLDFIAAGSVLGPSSPGQSGLALVAPRPRDAHTRRTNQDD